MVRLHRQRRRVSSVTTPSSNSALTWFKSSYSSPDGAACVEVAHTQRTVRVRDSKRSQSPRITFGSRQWSAFIEIIGGASR
ncbi:DUF397 domain-containing protein [Streptomyces seoulensis]